MMLPMTVLPSKRAPGSALFVALAVILLGSAIVAQGGRRSAWPPRTTPTQNPQGAAGGLGDLRRLLQEGLRQQDQPIFRTNQPFPTFPVDSPGFGQFPGLGLPVPFSGITTPAAPGIVKPRDPNAWPSWIQTDASIRAEEGFLPDRAILSRSAERVWYLSPEASAFVPLAFHDKFRLVTPGCQIQVRRRGEFQVLFHGGAVLRSRGPVELAVEDLSDERVTLRIDDYTHVWITARKRPIEVKLGSGETVLLQNSPGYFERSERLGQIKHAGGGVMSVESAVGSVDIPGAHRVELLAEAKRTGSPTAELALRGDITSIDEGRILRAEGGTGGGAVVWNGARFNVQAGVVLRIDPLAGEAFPNNRSQ